ncbi:MAG: noncanonical pyrimidine nucleotidase, YjjG family, partial [Ekhidna sp.]|nr:noncanonical pyrimidine nucleotidase, YjjG family [Ekhidna sp.]
MKGIEHIFFDLDHTLWDYQRNSKETLLEIYQRFLITNYSVSKKRFLNAFYEINDRFWHQYNLGEIDRNYIKEYRFK